MHEAVETKNAPRDELRLVEGGMRSDALSAPSAHLAGAAAGLGWQ